jgi:outer membrane protein OmpA-like peptidoglycan-associated protein
MGKKMIWLLSGFLILAGCAAQEKAVQNRKMVKEIEKMELEVKETERGVEILFPEVLLFDYNSDRLKSEAKTKMHKIAAVVNEPKVESRTIAVEGHADAIGSDAYNMDLSQRRSQSVGRALVFSGVRKERLAVKGMGESKPIAPNTNPDGSDNPEGRARNRRVEVIIEN